MWLLVMVVSFFLVIGNSNGQHLPITIIVQHLRKVTRNHRIFPSDEAVYKVLYLAIRNSAKKWTMPIHDWKPALNRFAIEFAGRFPE